MISFATQIRPLFRDRDVTAMLKARRIDLSSYQDVSSRANDILDRLSQGDMPCDGAWPPENVNIFKQWIADGKAP